MELMPSLEAYFLKLQNNQRLATLTKQNYRRDLLQLISFFSKQSISNWNEIDENHLSDYFSTKFLDGASARSLHRARSSIRGFFRYLHDELIIENDPSQTVCLPKVAKKLPKILDVDTLSHVLDHPAKSTLEIRDKAIWELFYSSGLRLNELVQLNLVDIDMEQRLVHVHHAKGKQERIVPVGRKALYALQQWLPKRLELLNFDPHTALFISRIGNRLCGRSIQIRLKQWATKCGLPQNLYPHLLRHSFASHMLESSSDLRAVQELLGHQNISTTQIYTHLDFQHLARVYDQSHPRAKRKN